MKEEVIIMKGLWGYDASLTSGIVWNCVIRETLEDRTMSHIYDNSNGGEEDGDCL